MPDVSGWSALELGQPLSGGSRSSVWEGRLDGERVVVRQSRRSAESLAWELDLLRRLAEADFVVPQTKPADDGRESIAGVVVQSWLDGGAPETPDEWGAVALELQRLHTVLADHPQRPGCAVASELVTARRSVDADLDVLPVDVLDRVTTVFGEYAAVPVAVIHGDPGPSNIRIAADGRVGLIDWDESRVDHVWHDLSNLGVQVLADDDHAAAVRLSHAWEAVNAWVVEPEYARDRLARLD